MPSLEHVMNGLSDGLHKPGRVGRGIFSMLKTRTNFAKYPGGEAAKLLMRFMK